MSEFRRPALYSSLLMGVSLLALSACTTPERKPAASRPLACYEKQCCDDPVSLGYAPHRMHCQAIVLDAQGKVVESDQTLQNAISTALGEMRQRGDATAVLCFALNTAGNNAEARGKDAESRAAFAASVEACRAAFGSTSDFASEALHDSANQHLDMGRLDLAQNQMREVVSIAKNNNNLGLESYALDALGRIAGLRGDRNEEQRLLRQAIEIKTKVFGESSYEAAISYTNLGASYTQANERVIGRDWFRRAVGIYASTVGPAHERTLSVATALAASHLADGELKQAKKIYDTVLPKALQTYGRTDDRAVSIIHDQGVIFERQGKRREALRKFEQALKIRRSTMPESLKYANTALNTAKMKKAVSGCSAARPLAAEAAKVSLKLGAAQADNRGVTELAANVAAFDKLCAPKRVSAKTGQAAKPVAAN